MNIVKVTVKSASENVKYSWSVYCNGFPTLAKLIELVPTVAVANWDSIVFKTTSQILKAAEKDTVEIKVALDDHRAVPVRVAGNMVGTIHFEPLVIQELSEKEKII